MLAIPINFVVQRRIRTIDTQPAKKEENTRFITLNDHDICKIMFRSAHFVTINLEITPNGK